MDLFAWMTKNNKTIVECASEWGFQYPTLHRIATRRGKASFATAQRIVTATRGEVRLEDLMETQPRGKPGARAVMRAVPLVPAAPAPAPAPPPPSVAPVKAARKPRAARTAEARR